MTDLLSVPYDMEYVFAKNQVHVKSLTFLR